VQLTSLSTFPGELIIKDALAGSVTPRFLPNFIMAPLFIVTLKVGIITSDPINKVPETLRRRLMM
jgi:hypothetical protein